MTMNDFIKTGLFAGSAALAVLLAILLRPVTAEPEQFDDQGERFYESFDAARAASLEVIDYDEASGTATPFKVQVANGVWTIPSHYDYPADGEDRLAETAAAVMELVKNKIQSDRAQDHETLGVIDPLDDSTPTLVGRGQRVTLRDATGAVLVDYIFGKKVIGLAGHRYVRIPGKKRTYAVKFDVELSTMFTDWIDTALLDLVPDDMWEITINDYSIDEATGVVNPGQSLHLSKSAGGWQLAEVPPGRELDEFRVRTMLNSLRDLRITGVRPKPESLTADLRAAQGISLDLPTQLSLQSRGFFVSNDGRLLSNEGEITFATNKGVRYTLRFGEVLVGQGMAISAGTEGGVGADDDEREEVREHRYVFITAEFDPSVLPPVPPAPALTHRAADDADTSHDGGDSQHDAEEESTEARMAREIHEQAVAHLEGLAREGQAEAKRLNDRFAPWYYVIAADDFQTIRPNLESLLQPIAIESME